MFYLSRLSGVLIVLQMSYILACQLTSEQKKEKKELPWFGAWIWLSIGLMAIFPELNWFQWMPVLFTTALMVNAWTSGKVQYLPALGLAQFISLIIALNSQSWLSNEIDVFSSAALLTGATALLFSSQHESGLLYKNTGKANPSPESSIFTLPETPEQKSELNEQLQIIGYIGLTFSLTILWGIGTMVGAIMLTAKVASKGQFNVLLMAPLAHSLAFYNCLSQADMFDSSLNISLIGALLIIEGIAFSIASIRNDAIYDYPAFDWPNDQSFFEFMDRLGIVGVGTMIAGIFFLINNDDWNTIAFGLTTVLLVGVGIQGYSEEFEARWRRVFGGYGSIMTTFITASTIDNELIQNIGLMFGAIVTMGWIFMGSSRLGDSNEIYVPDSSMGQPTPEAQQTQAVPEQVEDTKGQAAVQVEMETEAIEDKTASVEAAIEPEPAELPDLVVPLAIPAPVVAAKERVKTRHGFEIELPDDMFETILNSIDITPHEGYKPVVSFGPRGEIQLDFEPN